MYKVNYVKHVMMLFHRFTEGPSFCHLVHANFAHISLMGAQLAEQHCGGIG